MWKALILSGLLAAPAWAVETDIPDLFFFEGLDSSPYLQTRAAAEWKTGEANPIRVDAKGLGTRAAFYQRRDDGSLKYLGLKPLKGGRTEFVLAFKEAGSYTIVVIVLAGATPQALDIVNVVVDPSSPFHRIDHCEEPYDDYGD
jgi:hypothetical protein